MGAIAVLLPIYIVFLGVPRSSFLIWVTLFYTLAIALLMVSRLPVFSGKRVGTRVPPEMVGPMIVVMVLAIGLLMAYPWIVLTAGTLAYLASLPFGWISYRRYQQRSREATRDDMHGTMLPPISDETVRPSDESDRPSRLN
jgi:CDP-diacylglycerol--serine O-phosphatidyltransferase